VGDTIESRSKAVLFSTPGCPWCTRAKRYLIEKGVRVKEINVARDRKAATEMVRRSGQMGVPVIKIGSKWIVGFDRAGIDRALAARS
jgi:glutaredoxin-like YruB-family protein